MTTQTPDAVREAVRADITKQLDEPWRDRVILRPDQWQVVLAALDSRAGDAKNGNQSCATGSTCKTCSPWPASSSEPRLPSSSCGFVEQSADRAGDAGEVDQTKADYCPGYCARGEPHNGPHDPIVLNRQSGGQTAEVLNATPAPAVDDDDIDSPAARLDMVRVALSAIIDNPASAVPLARAGLDFCDLTEAQRKEMRGDA